MANDTVYVDSIDGMAHGPVRVRGTLAVGDWREPAFNLYLVSSGAELLNNDKGQIRVDAGLALTGPFDKAYLSGAATITQGVFYAPEIAGQHIIGAGDPALFNVLDTQFGRGPRSLPADVASAGKPARRDGARGATTTRGCATARRTSRSTPTIPSRCAHEEQSLLAHRRRDHRPRRVQPS